MNPSRRMILAPLMMVAGTATAKAAPAATPRAMPAIPSMPAPNQPPSSLGWDAIADLGDQLRESLPQKPSGNADLDFALAAAPLLNALSELAADRGGATRDPVIRQVCARLSRERLADLQTLIDWLEAKGHGAQ